jgi:hypothetical protein
LDSSDPAPSSSAAVAESQQQKQKASSSLQLQRPAPQQPATWQRQSRSLLPSSIQLLQAASVPSGSSKSTPIAPRKRCSASVRPKGTLADPQQKLQRSLPEEAADHSKAARSKHAEAPLQLSAKIVAHRSPLPVQSSPVATASALVAYSIIPQEAACSARTSVVELIALGSKSPEPVESGASTPNSTLQRQHHLLCKPTLLCSQIMNNTKACRTTKWGLHAACLRQRRAADLTQPATQSLIKGLGLWSTDSNSTTRNSTRTLKTNTYTQHTNPPFHLHAVIRRDSCHGKSWRLHRMSDLGCVTGRIRLHCMHAVNSPSSL